MRGVNHDRFDYGESVLTYLGVLYILITFDHLFVFLLTYTTIDPY